MKSLLRRFRPEWEKRKVSACLGVLAGVCAANVASAASPRLDQALSAYDSAVSAGANTPLAKLTTPVTLNGGAGAAFDFGATWGDTTIEFILEGDPTAGDDAYLAVGEYPGSSLRYAQWQATQQLGFTQSGVADYLFSPAVPSPTGPTHIAYVWNAFDFSMSVYVNGTLASTVTGVSDQFYMPSGAGFLGANASGGEAMTGTIHRVTVYPMVEEETDIQRNAEAFTAAVLPGATSFTATPPIIDSGASSTLAWATRNTTGVYLNGAPVTGTSLKVSPAVSTVYSLTLSNEVSVSTVKLKLLVTPRLGDYDAAIAADQASGLTPTATLTNVLNLTGEGGEPFDFGLTYGDVTMEFVLEGDPEATGDSGFLAVGEATSSSLRYEQWQNTLQMGFTQGGVADYSFVPGVPSPSIATHVAYVWDATAFSMRIYVNGVMSGEAIGVSDLFVMPSGMGYLGANPSGTEAMIGRIYRVAVYDEKVPEATLQKHAKAFTSVLRPPIIASFTATPTEIVGQGSAVLNWQVEDATGVYLNGTDVTGLTNRTVTPATTTSYTLVASNNVSSVSAKVKVSVTPSLTAYDAAVAADRTAGLQPLATLTNIVSLTGSAGAEFDFGPTEGDTTMEFIMEGDPTIGADGYLAVGENSTSNLRYAQWSNTRQMGFTQLGVADYLFTPAVASPTVPTLVTYVWDSTALEIKLYTNGVLAATATGVSDAFAMPTGMGFLGATATGGEAMVGRILRVVVYPGIVPEATIQKHGTAFATVPTGPSLSVQVANQQATVTLTGAAGGHYRVEYRDSLSAADAWQLLQDIPSLSGTTVQVTDPTSTVGRSQRFYRAAAAQ